MNRTERENWIINLEGVSKQIDPEKVRFVCEQHAARDVYHLSNSDLQEVYNELFQYAVDEKDG